MSDISDDHTKPGLNQLDEWQSLVDSLDSSELHLLNNMVCSRIDYLQASEIGRQMANFKPGDMVSFVDKKGALITGRVSKTNRKTISVIADTGRKWNVSPGLLAHARQNAAPSDLATLPSVNPKKVAPEADWLFSVVTMPGVMENDGKHGVAKVAIWMDGNGLLRHMGALNQGDEIEQIYTSFDEARSSIMAGPPCTPTHVTTDQTELIDHLRSRYPKIQFTRGDVPELLDIAEDVRNSFTSDEIPTYADLGISSNATAAFYDASAMLYKSAPWKALPSEHLLIDVSIKELGIENSVISVIGQQGLNFGVSLFNSIADHLLYTAVISNGPEGFERIPAHKTMSFEKGDSIYPPVRKEIMEQGWSIAGPNAYPELFLPVDGIIARSPTVDDLLLFEVLSRGMVAFLKHSKEVKAYWNTAKPFSFNYVASVSDRKLDINFNLPATPGNKSVEKLNALEKMALIDRSNLHDPSKRHFELVKEITAQFEVSEEYRALKQCTGGHTLLMELGFNYLDYTVATCMPVDCEEILYEVIPRKVMIKPNDAAGIIEDCKAFYQFLKRKYNHPIAGECLAVLGPEAKIKLRDALTDDSKYGVGKAVVGNGQFPFDLDEYSANELLPFIDTAVESRPEVALLKPTAAAEKSRKKKRKASKQSRKKNRR